MKVIVDASPIIAFFDELGEPELLQLTLRLGYQLLVPEAVCRDDITRDPSRGLLLRLLNDGSMSMLPPIGPDVLDDFLAHHPSLGRGESEVILNALALRASGEAVLCLLDESPARRVATELGLPIKGTLGVIKALRAAGLIDGSREARLLEGLRESTFRIGEKLLR